MAAPHLLLSFCCFSCVADCIPTLFPGASVDLQLGLQLALLPRLWPQLTQQVTLLCLPLSVSRTVGERYLPTGLCLPFLPHLFLLPPNSCEHRNTFNFLGTDVLWQPCHNPLSLEFLPFHFLWHLSILLPCLAGEPQPCWQSAHRQTPTPVDNLPWLFFSLSLSCPQLPRQKQTFPLLPSFWPSNITYISLMGYSAFRVYIWLSPWTI